MEMLEFKIIMDLTILKINLLKEHLDMMSVALIVKREETFYKILTKFLEIVWIFVSSPISVILKTEKMVE